MGDRSGARRSPGGFRVQFFLSMNREFHQNYSHELQRDMETLVFGHGGQPLLVFPSSQGRFFEYEDAGMVCHQLNRLVCTFAHRGNDSIS